MAIHLIGHFPFWDSGACYILWCFDSDVAKAARSAMFVMGRPGLVAGRVELKVLAPVLLLPSCWWER